MCSNGSASGSQCLNGGQCSLTDGCVCASACFVGNYCEINYNAVRLPLTGAIIQDHLWTQNIYVLVFVLLGVSGLLNNAMALATFTREKIRLTVNGTYLIFFSLTNIILMFAVLSYTLTIIRYDNATYRLWACHAIPFVGVIMVDASMLFTVALAVERVFLECWDFSVHGSRKRGLIGCLLIVSYACGSNVDEIFIRRIATDLMGNLICIYDFEAYPTWHDIDTVFSYAHVAVPCAMHLLCSVCVLTTIACRKIFIGSTNRAFYHVWLIQLYRHRDFLIPPISIILCILPHGILGHLLITCIPYSDKVKLRLHISVVLLLYVPQMLSFVLYVYPNKLYFDEFQQTVLYRAMCYYRYRKQKATRRKRYTDNLSSSRTSNQQELPSRWPRTSDQATETL